jgi:two-component system, NarL family, response regulator LiaR
MLHRTACKRWQASIMRKAILIRLLIVSNELAVRRRLTSLARKVPFIYDVVGTESWKDAIKSYVRSRPNIVFVHARTALSQIAIRSMCSEMASARIILLVSSQDGAWINKAIRAGAEGVLQKDATLSELSDCLRSAHEGKTYAPPNEDPSEPARKMGLTKRELEVLCLIADDKRNSEIGSSLFITEGTVKIHVHNILSKLGVNSRIGAITKALKNHWL